MADIRLYDVWYGFHSHHGDILPSGVPLHCDHLQASLRSKLDVRHLFWQVGEYVICHRQTWHKVMLRWVQEGLEVSIQVPLIEAETRTVYGFVSLSLKMWWEFTTTMLVSQQTCLQQTLSEPQKILLPCAYGHKDQDQTSHPKLWELSNMYMFGCQVWTWNKRALFNV